MNIFACTGNSTKDIEIRFSQSGTAFANGGIAVRRDFKNQAGDYETDFFNFTAIGKTGEIMADYVKKGDKFGITGRLQNRTYDRQDGSKQTVTEIIVNGFDFPSKTQNSGNSAPNNKSNTNIADEPKNHVYGQIDIQDDDLPF